MEWPPDGSWSECCAVGVAAAHRAKQEGIGSKNDANLKLLPPSSYRRIFSMNPKRIGRETKPIPNLEAFLLLD
jgi:hypothetical protein